MSQQEGGSARRRAHARAPIAGILTGRLTRIGLGALTSVVLASVAFAQGVWNGGEARTRTAAAETPDEASPAVPSAPGPLDSPSGSPTAEPSSIPKADSASAHLARTAERALAAPARKRRRSDSTGGASRADGDTPVTQAAPTSGGSSSQPPSDAQVLSASGWCVADTNPYWDQYTVSVQSNVPITELKVSVRVIQTGGVADTGAWSSLGDQVDVHTAANSEQLAYVVTLKSGVTLQPGTYTFNFSFNHDEGTRDAHHDLWAAAATPAGSTSAQGWNGHF